jgi:hypothetical protein
MNWHDVKGCKAGQANCDDCNAFIRIREQYCKRCGTTFYKRQMDTCRVFLFNQLEKAGAAPTSEWSTEKLKEMYLGEVLELNMEEGEELAKKTYYTKCGRQFQKSSTAEVTGYTINFEDPQNEGCTSCPFKIEVTEGWGDNKKFLRWECRAGSKEPNHKTEWVGSLEDKNTIQIHSLDYELMEEIRQYCIDHSELGASYNADHMADCRRTLSISCSANKKGIAAKKELIEKFFRNTEAVSDERFETDVCGDCAKFRLYDGALAGYGKCSYKNKRINKDHEACTQFELKEDEVLFDEQKCRVCGCTYSNGCPGGCYWVEDDLCSRCAENEPESCANCSADKDACQPYQACVSEGLEPEDVCENWKGENKEMISYDQMYIRAQEDCPYYCKHNKGCSLLIVSPRVAAGLMGQSGEVNCVIYQKANNDQKSYENDAKSLEIVSETAEIVSFDYSTVDQETAAFLQEKANRITEIRIKSVVAIGKELKEAQDRLANHKTGTFGAWSQSIGLSRQTVQNYIQAYDYIVKNFDNIEAAENIQPSLLFAASKPSAPKELAEKVASGDITTHKQYKELEENLRKAEERAERAVNQKFVAETRAIKAEQEMKKAKKEKEDALKAHKIELDSMHQQLEQAKRNNDPAKVRELGQKISEYQNEIKNYQEQIGKLNLQLQEKNRQLHAKPIEVPAVKEVMVIPDEVRVAIYNKVASLYEGLLKLTETEIKIFAEDVDPDYCDDVINGISKAITVLNYIDNAVIKAHNAESKSDEKDPIYLTDDPSHACGSCQKSDPDYDTDRLEEKDETWCPIHKRFVHIMDERCDEYVEYSK